ncbi:MAG TPA: hypothetical protein VLA05_09220 [Coriobacteriia bacterium]|nr:hypothetical protein [Coriobacteriia bacterium]
MTRPTDYTRLFRETADAALRCGTEKDPSRIPDLVRIISANFDALGARAVSVIANDLERSLYDTGTEALRSYPALATLRDRAIAARDAGEDPRARATLSSHDVRVLLLALVTYSIGRQTYIVASTCGHVRSYGHVLTSKDRQAVIAEIDAHGRRWGTIGADFDDREWRHLQVFLATAA